MESRHERTADGRERSAGRERRDPRSPSVTFLIPRTFRSVFAIGFDLVVFEFVDVVLKFKLPNLTTLETSVQTIKERALVTSCALSYTLSNPFRRSARRVRGCPGAGAENLLIIIYTYLISTD